MSPHISFNAIASISLCEPQPFCSSSQRCLPWAKRSGCMAASDTDLGGSGSEGEGCPLSQEGSTSEVESPALTCFLCKISSKDVCPVEKKRLGKHKARTRVAWARVGMRKVKNKAGKWTKMRRANGEWCRICYNIMRVKSRKGKFRKMEKKKKKNSGFKALKETLRKNPEERKLFEKMSAEAVHQKAGGRCRVTQFHTAVVQETKAKSGLQAPEKSSGSSRSTSSSSATRRLWAPP